MELLQKAWDTKTETPIQKLVLARLADRANGPKNSCWPGIASIAKDCCLTERSVYRVINQLLGAGLIRKESGTGLKSNTYFLVSTPDTVSPLTNRHPCHKVTQPLTECHFTPDTVSPKLKGNPNLTQRGALPVFDKELHSRIKLAEDEIDRLKCTGATSEADRAKIKFLRGKQKAWKDEIFNR